MAAPPQNEQRQSGPFTLPSIATMTQGIGQDKSPKQSHSAGGDMMRDSGMWSMQSPSKHSSTISSATGLSSASSSNGLQLQTILNSHDDSSHRFSSASATSAGTPSSARLSNHQQQLPHMNRSYDGSNTNDNNPRASIDANNTFFIDSRRSSIDSRVGVNMGGLAINPPSSSPYENHTPSHTTSQGSLASSVQQTRTPPQGTHVPHLQSRSNGPVGRRPVTSGGQPPRRAPPITANPRSGGMPNPMASTPTKGFAWAFPEHPEKDDLDDDISADSSRQGSLASSTNPLDSSSHLPYTLQHKAVTNLQTADSIMGSGNYSRTPELRVSHKLAERKRRSEMKDLFDTLNRVLPNSPGNKSSKWEVLSKAIDYIDGLKRAFDIGQKENRQLRADLEVARTAQDENNHLTNEITAMYQQLCRIDPNGHHVFGPLTNHMESKNEPQQPPPSRAGPGFAMQGVEYGHQYDRR